MVEPDVGVDTAGAGHDDVEGVVDHFPVVRQTAA